MFRNADGSQRVFSRSQLISEIATLTGVTIAVYNKSFVDEDGNNVFYAPDDKMVLFPDGALGATVYGTTPEEIDLLSGYGNATTTIVNTGVAITTPNNTVRRLLLRLSFLNWSFRVLKEWQKYF